MKITNLFLFSIIFLSIACSKKSETKFSSEYNYNIILPEDWSEYEADEEKTNAFFNTKKWTGNLRITSISNTVRNPTDFLNKLQIENNASKINWNNSVGIYYLDKNPKEEIHFWYLIINNQLFICSFTVGNLKGDNEIQNELHMVENILKSIKKL